jgi:hypothetical protein
MGDRAFSIDVRKDHLEALKDIYKALHTIGKLQQRDAIGRGHAAQSASVVGAMLKLNAAHDPAAVQALLPRRAGGDERGGAGPAHAPRLRPGVREVHARLSATPAPPAAARTARRVPSRS